ncbi:hypothetical protein MNBD_GAMMA02-997 [hydrothermal vent metagenome]|uniref:DUF4276 family protein n=1 Tax=hydrothermal vent metagenome TaxID=652676 RepID=A0A3B0W7N2_9ZZZZ
MHFEVLVEDVSGKNLLELLIPKIINQESTYRVFPYKGIGKIPKGLKGKTDPSKRILLDRLPIILNGYGKTFSQYPSNYKACLIIICDLDSKNFNTFKSELLEVLNKCTYQPLAKFCIAIEEGEAWLLGDVNAVKRAYPDSNNHQLSLYNNDSICNTWEYLADIVYKGGANKLKKEGWQKVGLQKSIWAKKIGEFMNVNSNKSPSFKYFKKTLNNLDSSI